LIKFRKKSWDFWVGSNPPEFGECHDSAKWKIPEATLVAKARNPKGTNIAVRTFDLIRDISFF